MSLSSAPAKRGAPTYLSLADLGVQPVNVSVKEALAISRLGLTSMYAHLNAGNIKSVLIGRRRLVNLASLLEFLGKDVEPPPRYRSSLGVKPGAPPLQPIASPSPPPPHAPAQPPYDQGEPHVMAAPAQSPAATNHPPISPAAFAAAQRRRFDDE